MPRMQRLFFPGAMVHIMARGIEGRKIFSDDQDKLEFLTRFTKHRAEIGYLCHAWCLMDNHYHFLLRLNEQPVSKLMRPLNGGFARWFNKKYDRRGYLFQDRYKSVLCQDQEYAQQLVRYIHLNPIRGGLVKNLNQLKSWKWCGHAFLLGRKNALGGDFQERTRTLRRFGRAESLAIENYLTYLTDGIKSGSPEKAGWINLESSIEFNGAEKGWPAVIGNPEFVRNAMSRHNVGNVRRHRTTDYDYVLGKIHKEICAAYNIRQEELFRRARQSARAKARFAFCYKTHKEELLPLSVISRYLNISIPSVTNLMKHGEDIVKKN